MEPCKGLTWEDKLLSMMDEVGSFKQKRRRVTHTEQQRQQGRGGRRAWETGTGYWAGTALLGLPHPRWAWQGQAEPCRKEEKSWGEMGAGRSPRVQGLPLED